MHTHTRQDLYRAFIEYVNMDSLRERSTVRRKMAYVLLWCFIVPALFASISLTLIKMGVLQPRMRAYIDWVMLVFPVLYSLYAMRSGAKQNTVAKSGVSKALAAALEDSAWREKISDELKLKVPASVTDWSWIAASYRMDLEKINHRVKHITALAGAVFFLLMNGIESLGDSAMRVTLIQTGPRGWVETSSNDFTQYVSLALFLLLLYLSGTENYQALRRYLNCAELLGREK